MFLDITHYDKRRNRHGSKVEGPREPSGHPKRSTITPEYMVYFVRLDGESRTKVGRTQHIRQRIADYEHSTGRVARCLAQIIVASLKDSVDLEFQAIKFLRSRFTRGGKEWFDIPDDDFPTCFSALLNAVTVPVKEVRGLPGADSPEVSAFQEALVQPAAIRRQYKLKRW